MTNPAASIARRTSAALVGAAVNRSPPLSIDGLVERLFTAAFSRLVYPQIWEDPLVDLEALELHSSARIVTIASGGCNVLNYAVSGPGQITAVDLNAAHVALTRLKIAAARELDYAQFYSLFAETGRASNVELFDTVLKQHLDAETARYWSERNWRGRRRIQAFASNFYRTGLLGRFITFAHVIARLHGVDPRDMMQARTLEEQCVFFETELAPLLERKSVRWMINRPASLFGLGIPPAQYKALAGDHAGGIAPVLRHRLERLACHFPLQSNYFARQAFGQSYGGAAGGALPPYLARDGFERIKAHIGRLSIRHVSFTEHLAGCPDLSTDRYVLLDAQDWMNDADLTRLWREITRTARPGARVIFRTAAEQTLLPGRVPNEILSKWNYLAERSRDLTAKDRSAIYGGFHLYVKAA